MSSCAHPRRWFYRSPFVTSRAVRVIERCQECGANVRGEAGFVSRAEVVEAGLFVGLLGQDPWGGRDE